MTLEDYKYKMERDHTWAPGWEAIENSMQNLYGNQIPDHYAADLEMRASAGGNEYIDGISVYYSPEQIPHKHIVTYGFSDLYAGEEYYAKKYSGWGFELTIRLPSIYDERWTFSVMSNLARYVNNTENAWFEAYEYIAGNGKSVNLDKPGSKITAFILVPDPELPAIETLHGSLEFLQLVGIMEEELQAIINKRITVKELAVKIKEKNPLMITDMNRMASFLY